MQPAKPKKSKEITLLDRLRKKHFVELGMELKGFVSGYTLDGTRDRKILVATTEGEFLGSSRTIDESIRIIASFERRNVNEYDKSKIQTTYLHTEEEVETKIREEAMPKRFPKANGIEMYGRRFYIVKKQPNGKSSGKIFCLYNWKTRNLIFVHYDRDMLIGFLYNRYELIKDKDVM
jgi:hypothetical protein